MKWLACIMIILCFRGSVSTSSKFYTNAPDLVYPALEEFISENHLRGTSTLESLQRLDSVTVKDLGYEVSGPYIYKLTGKWLKNGKNNTILIDSSLLESEASFKKTLHHELGHFFGLKHINVDDLPLNDPKCFEVMSNRKSPYYNQILQEKVMDNYYIQLHQLLMPKTSPK